MLLERDRELARISAALVAAGAGRSETILVRGGAGIGRSSLLGAAADLAPADEFWVLRANAAAAEAGFAYGVVGQLFDSLWAVRADPMAHRVAGCADDILATAGSAPEAIARNALLDLLAELGRARPVLMLVDDLQWADEASLRWLASLGERLPGLRMVLVAALRDGDPRTGDVLVGRVADTAVTVLRPVPLSAEAIGTAVLGRCGRLPTAEVTEACGQASGGNPLFLTAILTQIAAPGRLPADGQVTEIGAARPVALRERLAGYLRDQPGSVRRVAAAIAAVGGEGDTRLVCRLAGVDPVEGAAALRALTELGLLGEGRHIAFRHRVVRDAVESTMTAEERAEAHDAAAGALYDLGHPVERVASHLLDVPHSAHPWAVDALCAAADHAVARGAPESGARYLRRALLDRRLAGEQRARLLIELASAERHFDPDACRRHVLQAVPQLVTAEDRAAAVLRIPAEVLSPQPREVTDQLRVAAGDLGALSGLDGPAREAALLLEARLWHDGIEEPAELAAAVDRLEQLGTEPPVDSAGERQLLAVLVNAAMLTGRLPADRIAEHAGRILRAEQTAAGRGAQFLPLALLALVTADGVDQPGLWLPARPAPDGDPYADVEQAWVLLAQGRLSGARGPAERAARVLGAGGTPGAMSLIAAAWLAVDGRDRRLSERLLAEAAAAPPAGLALTASMQIVAASGDARRGRWHEALEAFLACGRALDFAGWRNVAWFSWRVWVIVLHQRLGDHRAAAAMVEEEHDRAAAWGAPGPIGRALRLRASLAEGPRAVELLRESVGVLRRSANRLELARALGALSRQASGAEAAAALREGAALAGTCGAPWVAEGVDEAAATRAPSGLLTRTERMVAGLVAQGHTNQQIADELAVSCRAIEKHLTNCYRKLDVRGRAQFIGKLAEFGVGD